MGHYRDLEVWQSAHGLAVEVSEVVRGFPTHERFELASQLRRAALSVPTNLAEGQGRWGPREALRFARIAAGSLAELESLLVFASARGYLSTDNYVQLDSHRKQTARLLYGLIRGLQRRG